MDAGAGGIEGGFDEHLRGTAGEEIQVRDSRQNPIPGRSILVKPPVPGGDVILTLDRDLQEIGQEALADAIRETGAKGREPDRLRSRRPVRSSLWFPFRTESPGTSLPSTLPTSPDPP